MEPRDLIAFLGKVGKLKSNTRHCWTAPDRQESVSDHCHRLSLMPLLLREEFPDLDMDRVLRMCILHDLGEAVTGDVPAFLKTDADREAEARSVKALLSELPPSVCRTFSELLLEFEENVTPEAKLVHALDKMETLIAHNESELSTWLPVERKLNFTYGAEAVAPFPWLVRLREEINSDSQKKLDAEAERERFYE